MTTLLIEGSLQFSSVAQLGEDKKDQVKSATVAATQNHNKKLFLKNHLLNI